MKCNHCNGRGGTPYDEGVRFCQECNGTGEVRTLYQYDPFRSGRVLNVTKVYPSLLETIMKNEIIEINETRI